jgi:hypothetical protein
MKRSIRQRELAKRLRAAAVAACLALAVSFSFATARAPASQAADQQWPTISSTAKPWAYWYWMGGAVDKPGLSRHLEHYRSAGLGGVHIVPVYGVRGAEAKFIPFLSPSWVELLNHACSEAKRLGMGIDMTCGTGWPFGGPWVQPPFAAAQYTLEDFSTDKASRVTGPIRPRKKSAASATLVVLMAYGPNNEVLNLTDHVDTSGNLDWQSPSPNWKLTALFQAPTNLPVERAAPGGEGLTIDYFSRDSLMHYLQKFDASLPGASDTQLRAVYNDSYENWGQNWTPRLFDEFPRRRGYDLRAHLSKLSPSDTSEEARRVRADFRETMSDLIRDEFTKPWVEWAHKRHMIVRNEGHGSPGNPLDLYAIADIPETEVFGTSWLEPLGLKPLPGVPAREGGAPEVQVCKLASSAAHVAGRQLCSSETCTWLGDHFKIPLEHMKAQADLMFVMGVNHIFFHGAAYSPEDAPWPGWLWYAATNVGPYMPAWEHMPALCNYIARCQACLQSSQSDNDVLVYFPIYDLWASDEGSRDNLQYTIVHSTPVWLEKLMPGFAAVGRTLWTRGYSYDAISDLQIASLSVEQGSIIAPGGRYKALVVPECRHMPVETLKQILRLARSGATVISHKELPSDVPGLANLETRRTELRQVLEELVRASSASTATSAAISSKFLKGENLEELLATAGVSREPLVDLGLKFVRRRDNAGWTYFIVNHSDHPIKGYVPVSVAAHTFVLLDPLTTATGKAHSKTDSKQAQIFLDLEPRQSVILRACSENSQVPDWKYLSDGDSELLTSSWSVEFLAGGPNLPQKQTIKTLSNWTTWNVDSENLRSFSGTAKYETDFNFPVQSADRWALDLGDVCHSARVRLNGKDLGTVIASPFRLDATNAIQPGSNHLEVEVINLPANRVADLDRRGQDWKKFLFVDIKYRPFDASRWTPIPSGLIGPVKLIAEHQLTEHELNQP